MSTTVEITDSEVADLLEKSLALMNDSGAHWTQWSYKTGYGAYARFCSVGAISQTLGLYDRDPRGDVERQLDVHVLATRALARTIQERGLFTDHESDSGKGIVIDWNDTHGRVWAEVVDIFGATIRRLRKKSS